MPCEWTLLVKTGASRPRETSAYGMTQQPLSQIPRPSASSYTGKKSLFLVPNYMAAAGLPEEAQSW